MEQVEEQRLFPQDKLFWEMVRNFKDMRRRVRASIHVTRWYVLGFKHGWRECHDRGAR